MSNKMPELTMGDVTIEGNIMTILGKRIAVPKVGDYVTLWEKPESTKRHFAQVDSVGKGRISVTYEHLRHLDDYIQTDIEYPLFHVVENHGQVDPETNTLYGQPNVHPWVSTLPSKMGKVHFFRHMDKRERKDLLAAIDRVYEIAVKQRWNIFPLDIEVRPPRGKWAGTYGVYKPVKDKPPRLDVITLHPKEWDRKLMDYVLLHELVHGLQHHVLTAHEVGEWVKSYHRSITLDDLGEDELQEVLRDFMHAGYEYTAPNERHQYVFDIALGYINDYHKLARKDVWMLMEIGQGEILRDMWPKNGEWFDQKPEVSEYGTTNWKEYNAEAISLHMANLVKLPKNVRKLVESTLKAIIKRTSPLKPVEVVKVRKKKAPKPDTAATTAPKKRFKIKRKEAA